MNSSDILEVLDCIGAEPSLNVKIQLLNDFSADEDFVRTLELAYNPLKRYHIQQLPDIEPGEREFENYVWTMFERMSTGELSGAAAKSEVYGALHFLNASSQELFKRILLKDLRADFGPKLINKAIRGLIKLEPYMRCSLPKHVNMTALVYPLFSQLKMDGTYLTITKTAVVRIATRQGQEFPDSAFPELRTFAEQRIPLGHQVQGEVVFLENDILLKRAVSNGLVNSALQLGNMPTDAKACYFVWDIVSLEDIQKGSKKEYRERFSQVQNEIADGNIVKAVESRLVNSFEEAAEHFKEVTDRGEEGTIVKMPQATWKNGTSRQQIKLKGEATCELRVIGFLEGRGKFVGQVGSLMCQSECQRLVVYVSGFTDEERSNITDHFYSQIKEAIIEVKHNGVTKSKVKDEWSLLHPRFVEMRFDKNTADDLSDIDPRGGFEAAPKSSQEDFYKI